ncbi:zinc-binding dehydrogenase [Nonomuraea sp. NBC_01738]|uniref:zinc-binding dehydrogenase n=1 Tax=Nonomuraea sp. NBC_01738 TaxID=2976003 RepID=UPI002E0E8DDD
MDSAPVDPGLLSERNISVGGYWLGAHLRLPGSTAAEALTELIALTAAGRLRPVTGAEYGLEDAGRALADLVARRTVGKVILRP